MDASAEALDQFSNVIVRRMEPSDASALLSILRESPSAASWSEESLGNAARCETAWVAEREGRVVGFLIGRAAADEFEILNLAVARAHRRRGVAARLLKTMIAWMQTARTRRAFLEVRASNEAALALYARHQFRACGRRARYYQGPEEDAILLSRDRDGTL